MHRWHANCEGAEPPGASAAVGQLLARVAHRSQGVPASGSSLLIRTAPLTARSERVGSPAIDQRRGAETRGDTGSNRAPPPSSSRKPDPSLDRAETGEIGTAYRIRTGDLRLERAVSWASRRMRHRDDGGGHRRRGEGYQRARDASTVGSGGPGVRADASRGTRGWPRRPAGGSVRRQRGRSANARRRARTPHRATRPAVRPHRG